MVRRHKPPSLPRIRVPYWGVVRCAVGKERWCRDNIRKAGGRTFVPRIRATRSPILTALFPGYVFVLIDGPWGYLRSTMGVIQVLMDRGRPAACQKKLMDELIKAQGEDGYIDLSPPLYYPDPGERTKVGSGLFKDHMARYIAALPQDRVKLIVGFLGKDYELELRRRDIGPPDP